MAKRVNQSPVAGRPSSGGGRPFSDTRRQSSVAGRRQADSDDQLFGGFDESAFEEVDVSIGPAGELAFGRTPAVRVNGNGRDRDVVKGAIAGAIAGSAGALVMNQFQALWSKMANHDSDRASAGGRHDARDWQERNEDANANELVAQKIADATIDRPLTRDELRVAAPAVHYSFGAAMGAAYGAAAESFDANPLTGAGWGALLWIGADEVAVPAFGLSKSATHYSFETHAQSFAAHIVYGITTEIVRRVVRAAM